MLFFKVLDLLRDIILYGSWIMSKKIFLRVVGVK